MVVGLLYICWQLRGASVLTLLRNPPYAYRWCFTDRSEAMYFLDTIEEFDEIPTRTQSLRGHRFDCGFARVIHYDKDGYRKW